jgi:hypothetical protein
MCTAKNARKLDALQRNPAVALTIDTEVHPPQVLLLRGRAELDPRDSRRTRPTSGEVAEDWRQGSSPVTSTGQAGRRSSSSAS